MQKKFLYIVLALLTCSMTQPLVAADMKVGFVNIRTCVDKTKLGKKERNAFEQLKEQLGKNLEKTQKEIQDLGKKLEDQDFLDSLSPAAETELNQKLNTMSQEFARYQNQYYQLLQQANYKMLQEMQREVARASEKVRDRMKLSFILNEESAFAFSPSDNVTDAVMQEMDRQFELENSDGKKEDSEKSK